MTITVVFDPPLPSDSPATFNTKAFATLGDLNDWSTEANALAAEINAGVPIADATHAATSKPTPVDADEIPMSDSAAANVLKKLTWANLKATLFGAPIAVTANSSSAALTVTQTGSGNAFVVEDSASTDSTPFVINAAGYVVAGHTGAAISGAQLQTVSSAAEGLGAVNISADTNGPVNTFAKARGTAGTPTVVLSGDTISRVDFSGHDGTGYIVGARITAVVDGTPGTNDMPGRLVFSTTADGASSPTERMRINSAGNVIVTSPGGLGYGTGAGGTVTQATSKATAVTLNKPTGQITMHNAALAAGALVTFTLNNSLVAVIDGVLLTVSGGGASGANYTVRVAAMAAGVVYITVTNVSAGSLSEAITINFAVIKGATT